MKQVRTDLAMESCGASSAEMQDVHVSKWESGEVTVTEVVIEGDEGARMLGKAKGNYITLECEGVKRRELSARMAVARVLGEQIIRLLPEGSAPVLVIGLGNRHVTPDALGPLTVDGTLVTRHLYKELPDEVDTRMSSVCAVAPGVLGVTGIETMEVVRSIVKSVKPRAVIAIDSLSSRALSRVGSTVQLTDTGIQPGSGVGNHRSALSSDALGTKVLAIGVPMVIYAATIARDAFELLASDSELADQEQALNAVTEELFRGVMGEMIVTPREVDNLVADAAAMLATGLNKALQPGLSDQEIMAMMQ